MHKPVTVMEKKTNLQQNQIHHLEDTMIMYGVYNTTTWKERTFTGKLNQVYQLYLIEDGIHNFAINYVLFLTTVREKYIKMYETFIEELKHIPKPYESFQKTICQYIYCHHQNKKEFWMK